MEQNACEWPGHGDSAGSMLASTLGHSIVNPGGVPRRMRRGAALLKHYIKPNHSAPFYPISVNVFTQKTLSRKICMRWHI